MVDHDTIQKNVFGSLRKFFRKTYQLKPMQEHQFAFNNFCTTWNKKLTGFNCEWYFYIYALLFINVQNEGLYLNDSDGLTSFSPPSLQILSIFSSYKTSETCKTETISLSNSVETRNEVLVNKNTKLNTVYTKHFNNE